MLCFSLLYFRQEYQGTRHRPDSVVKSQIYGCTTSSIFVSSNQKAPILFLPIFSSFLPHLSVTRFRVVQRFHLNLSSIPFYPSPTLPPLTYGPVAVSSSQCFYSLVVYLRWFVNDFTLTHCNHYPSSSVSTQPHLGKKGKRRKVVSFFILLY